jgi:integrase
VPTKNLTDLFCTCVKPPANGRVEYFDASFGGLALRVTERGHKSFSVHYRINGRLRRYTLGTFPGMRPAQARREASAALELARAGTDPTAAKQARRYQISPEAETFSGVLDDYLAHHMAKNTVAATFAEAKRMLERDVVPTWGDRPIASLTRRDVIALIDGVTARGAEVHANRLQARLRALFNWAIEKGIIAASPVEGLKPPTKERARDRVLSDEEIQWLWRAADDVGWPFGELAKLLLLTAQRRDEVAGMEWAEVDFEKRTWTIPREKAKNDRAHEVQLSHPALDVLKSLPRIGNRFVFTTTGEGPISGFSRGKRRIDAAMIRARCQLGVLTGVHSEMSRGHADKPLPVEIPHWIMHDLRRTAATGMARLRIPPFVVDKVLNHVSGTIRGVAAVYNRFEYLDERRAAMDTWGRFVCGLTMPVPADVIQLRA